MICGVSAGFAGVFGVPISGALFGMEVLSVGTVFYEVMFPAFISGITAFQVTHLFGVEYIYHPMNLQTLNIDSSLLHVFLSGMFFGAVGLVLIEALKVTQIIFRFLAVRFSNFWRCFIAAALLILLALLTSPAYLGLSMERVEAILAGEQALTFGFLYKIFATSLTFAGGGVGGLITPVLFIGANAGYFFAHILGLNTITFAALGMVSVLAGVANTPLAASVMAIELFGATIAPYAAVSCIVSFLVTGRRSIFSKQHFTFDKNLSEDDETSCERQSVAQLETTLKKKNFILSSVRHLIPDMKNFEIPLPESKKKRKKNKRALPRENQTPSAPKRQEAEIKPQEDAAKTKKRFSFLSHLTLNPGGNEEDKTKHE
ncbi:MAG: chloride channel protein [Elusimicrobiaceae bacterium]|nr:chloride channel protein [Elusimicrobiaceae bacterium]